MGLRYVGFGHQTKEIHAKMFEINRSTKLDVRNLFQLEPLAVFSLGSLTMKQLIELMSLNLICPFQLTSFFQTSMIVYVMQLSNKV